MTILAPPNMASLPVVTERTFEQEVLMSELPVLLEFSAEWCGPCKQMAPDLQALARELEGKAKVVTLDIDKSPNIPRQMGVQSVPTFVVFHGGRPVGGKVGAMRKAELRGLLEPYLPRAEGAIRPEELVQLLQAGRVSVVDTREAPVFNRAHLPTKKSRRAWPSFTCSPPPPSSTAVPAIAPKISPPSSPNKAYPSPTSKAASSAGKPPAKSSNAPTDDAAQASRYAPNSRAATRATMAYAVNTASFPLSVSRTR